MKKELIITFDIYQDSLDNQKPNFTIYSESIPDNLDKFNEKELEESGLKKMIKFNPERKDINGKLARQYIVRIPAEKVEKLLDF